MRQVESSAANPLESKHKSGIAVISDFYYNEFFDEQPYVRYIKSAYIKSATLQKAKRKKQTRLIRWYRTLYGSNNRKNSLHSKTELWRVSNKSYSKRVMV